jgi:hypothetical protein
VVRSRRSRAAPYRAVDSTPQFAGERFFYEENGRLDWLNK